MITALIIIAIIVLLIVVDYLGFSKKSNTNPPHQSGVNVWLDEGKKTKPFFHPGYQLVAKPDAIQKIAQKLYAIEYKSRESKVFESDIVQLKAACLAARANGYKIYGGFIVTNKGFKEVSLPSSDRQLFKQISQYHQLVMDIKAGRSVKASPTQNKCRSCGYRHACTDYAYKVSG